MMAQMTPRERDRLAALLNRQNANEPTSALDPLLGLMADDSELMDQVVKEALKAREQHP
jgi:hypothetical protein